MKKIILLCCVTLAGLQLFAQINTGSLLGKVTTAEGRPAADVTVLIKNTNKGTITDENGHFEFRKMPAGSYEIEISLIGYETLNQAFSIEKDETERLALQLKLSDKELQEVVIKGGQRSYKVSRPSTSLRLQTPLLELPQNIQVVTSKLINDQQIFDMLEGVTRNVSGATRSEHWDNYANITMRGQQIGSFRNGMNVQMPWGPLVEDMSMVDRIEFVKGPAGFMLANGEPTGMYNVVTKKPTGVNRGEASFTMGSYDTYRSTLDLDGKLSNDGKLLYRLNLMGQLKGSYRDFDYTNRYSIAPVISYKIDDKTSLTAEYTYQYMRMSLIGAAYVFSPKGYGELPRNFTDAEPNLEPTNMKDQSIFLNFTHQLNANWRFTTQLAYLKYKQVGSSHWPSWPVGLLPDGTLYRDISIWDAEDEAKLGQAFVTGELNTGSINHRILAGLDMGNKNYMADWGQSAHLQGYGYDVNGNYVPVDFNIYNPVHGNVPGDKLPAFDRSLPLRARANGNTMGESYSSLYMQDELRFLRDRIRLTLAGRYTSIKQNAYGSFSDDNQFTPRVGLSVSLDKQTSVYGLFDQAFVPQQGVDSLNKPLVPVTGNNIELGIKRDWFGGKWNTTAAVYRIIRNNVVSSVPGPVYRVVQTGQTETQGIEFDLRGEITRGLNLTANYAFTQAKITQDADKSKIGGMVPGTGFADHVTNAWLSYRLLNGKAKGLGMSLGYQWMIGRNAWDWGSGAEGKQLPDYFRLDGNLSWQDNRYSVSLNVNNILNKYLFSGAPYELDGNSSTTEYYYQIEAGTNFRFTVAYRF